MKKRILSIGMAFAIVCLLSACNKPVENSKQDPSLNEQSKVLEEATAWFEEQTSHYEIISGEAYDDTVVFLTGTKNPGTDSYQMLQAFVVDKTNDTFEVVAMNDSYLSLSAGVSVRVLATDELTVIFGDTGDSIYDLANDTRLDVDFTEVNILTKGGKTTTKKIEGNAPYLLVFVEQLEISDIEFVGAELSVKYSDFYEDKLMEDAASYDVTNVFDQS